MRSWLAAVLLRVGELGPWGPILFALLYIGAAVTMAPAFVLTVAAGALFGVWRGSALVFVSATIGACAVYALARRLAQTRFFSWILRDRRVAIVRRARRLRAATAQGSARHPKNHRLPRQSHQPSTRRSRSRGSRRSRATRAASS